VTNNTDMPLSVSPEDFRVEVVTPKPKVLLYVPPAELNLPPAQSAAAASPVQSVLQASGFIAVAPSVEASLPGKSEDAEIQKAAQREAVEKVAAQQHLAATSIAPSEVARGRVYFASDKKAQLVNVVLPIAGVVFEFPYALKR
jgi:poly(3-hydroxybutyrate) depolymerase